MLNPDDALIVARLESRLSRLPQNDPRRAELQGLIASIREGGTVEVKGGHASQVGREHEIEIQCARLLETIKSVAQIRSTDIPAVPRTHLKEAARLLRNALDLLSGLPR